MKEQTSYRGEVECLRLAKFPKLLRQLSLTYDLELTLEIDKGWIREYIMFKVEGTDNNILNFKSHLEYCIKEYQS